MGESLESTDKQGALSRRKFLEKAVGGLAAAGMAAAAPRNADAMAILRWLEGKKTKEELRAELNEKFHAARVYMAHNNGELEKNLERLGQEVGTKLLNGDYERVSEKNRGAEQKKDMKPIFAERNEILARFDPQLIPGLLVLYVQNDLKEKSLVKVYQELGGDIEKIVKQGLDGVDEHLVDEIMSEMTYHIGLVRGRGDYGIPDRNALSFKRRPAPTPTDIPLPRPQLKK